MSGYGDSKRRRDRDGVRSPEREKRTKDSHRHRREEADGPPQGKKENKEKDKKEKKEQKEQKDHKEHKERKGDPPEERRRSNRSRSRDRAAQVASTKEPEEALLGRTPSRRETFAEASEQKKAWREELDARKDGEEDEEEAPADGIIPMEDDDDVDAALRASRARREALIAKWVNKGEAEDGLPGTLETPDTNLAEGGGSSESEGEAEGEMRREAEAPQVEDTEESRNRQKDLMRFILAQKAEHDGDMFGENEAEDDKLKAVLNHSEAISQTGASGDDWDDHEGYYKAKIGEVMAGRYLVVEDFCGKGVFAMVVKAKDQETKEMVAIKIVRRNDMMKKATEKECDVL